MPSCKPQNQLTACLFKHARDEYQSWNDLAVHYKQEIVAPVISEKVALICQAKGLPEAVIHAVQWDILGALMENHYLYTGHLAFFRLELL